MAGYSTEERLIGPKQASYEYAGRQIVGLQRKSVEVPPSFQSTTSFRTKGGGMSEALENPNDYLILNKRRQLYPHDSGHEFYSLKVRNKSDHRRITLRGNNGSFFRGPAYSVAPTTTWGNSWRTALPNLAGMDLSKGTRAISATRPDKPSANFAQLLSELILQLPALPFKELVRATSWKELTSAAGGEYLNTVFAWQPLVQDVLKICEAVVKADDILSQFIRDSERPVRRAFDFDPEVTTTKVITGTNVLAYFPNSQETWGQDLFSGAGSVLQRGDVTRTTVTSTHYWFRGCWTYFLEGGSDLLSNLALQRKLADRVLGLNITPALLWELAPWSWLTDWFLNIGDVISAVTATTDKSQVLKYGYLMREISIEDRFTHTGIRSSGGDSTGPFTTGVDVSIKARRRATPYGFGLNTASFTANQWAILVALGLAKNPGRMAWD